MSTNQNKFANKSYFMRLALAQAQKNIGNTKDNPSVGCIITKNNNVISAECTGIYGTPHAEQNAINKTKADINDSTMYVTLEPCSHYGKTPPCTNLIIKSRIKKVFFSLADSDLRSRNQSGKLLKKKNISTNRGVNLNETKLFYRSYIKSFCNLLPFVTCKIAASKDFFTIDKKNKWITNKFSRGRVHLMRSMHDCIISSYKTILSDNPRLTCRITGLEDRSPARIILDKNLNISLSSNIFNDSKIYRTIIFYSKFNKEKINILNKMKVETFRLPLSVNKNFDLNQILLKVKLLGFQRVFVEAGMRLSLAFLQGNLVDDFNLFISNKSLKANGSNNIKKYLKLVLKDKKSVIEKVNLFGEKLLSYKIK